MHEHNQTSYAALLVRQQELQDELILADSHPAYFDDDRRAELLEVQNKIAQATL